jgi:hypothetical protein
MVHDADGQLGKPCMERTIMTNKPLIAGLEPAAASTRTIPVVLHRQAETYDMRDETRRLHGEPNRATELAQRTK